MKILILGLSKTGTTALFFLIKNSLETSGSSNIKLLFEPTICPSEILSYNGTVLAKVLLGPNVDIDSFSSFDKKIVIIRDPRDRLISSLLYSQYHNKMLLSEDNFNEVYSILKQKENEPSSVSIFQIWSKIRTISGLSTNFDDFIRMILNPYKLLDTTIQKFKKENILIYFYEDFVQKKYEPLSEYLGLKIVDNIDLPERLKRVVRTKSYGNWRNWFTLEDIKILKPIINPILKKYKYDPNDWEINSPQFIDPLHCSEYFKFIIQEQKKNFVKTKILKVDIDKILGWAFIKDSKKPLSVKLYVNGKLEDEDLAIRLRQGLKDKNIHPTGRCGFLLKASRPFNEKDLIEIEYIFEKKTIKKETITIDPYRQSH